jgi:hypothetical protein
MADAYRVLYLADGTWAAPVDGGVSVSDGDKSDVVVSASDGGGTMVAMMSGGLPRQFLVHGAPFGLASPIVDPHRRTVLVNGQPVRLPRLAFDLVAYLAATPGYVRTRAQIMDAIGTSLNTSERSIDSQLKAVRRAGITAIRTDRGVGYYWEE